MNKPFHFYVVFNPMINQKGHYQTQAHEFYHNLKRTVSNSDSDQSFMYWGKLKVNENSSEELEKFSEALEHNKAMGEDTHLYISDYHHFWVAKVESVHSEIFNKNHTLAFYDNKDVDIWFKITDMDLLSAEFEETSLYLKQLYVDNKFNNEKINFIHPYLGGLKFPLVVQDHSTEKYFQKVFQEDGMRISKNNPLLESPKFSDDVKYHMKSFVLPPQVFSKLSNLVKKELLSVETIIAKRENENPSLYQNILGSYLRILESVMNETLGHILNYEYGSCLYVEEKGEKFSDHQGPGFVPLNQFKGNISIQAFASLLNDVSSFGNLSLDSLNSNYPTMVNYFTEELLPIINNEELIDKRKAMQSGNDLVTSKQAAFHIRNQILGVGCKGVINNLFQILIDETEQQYFMQAS